MEAGAGHGEVEGTKATTEITEQVVTTIADLFARVIGFDLDLARLLQDRGGIVRPPKVREIEEGIARIRYLVE